jgi:hypothetical protein
MEIEGSLVYDVCKDVLCGAVPTGESWKDRSNYKSIFGNKRLTG